MVIILKVKLPKLPGFLKINSSQITSAICYILIVTIALVGVNIYASTNSRNMLFRSQYNEIDSKAKLISSSLSGIDRLNPEKIGQIVDLLGNLGGTRIFVTDETGKCIFDSSDSLEYIGKYFLYSDIYLALKGKDTFHCLYDEGQTVSYYSIPVVNYGVPIGAVYLISLETEQSGVIALLERNLLTITMALEAIFVIFAVVLSIVFSGRAKKILSSFPHIREGEYSYKIGLKGNDEYALLANEFDKLTDKLADSEDMRRRFVSDASHELKTPLASIKLLSETILQNELDEETKREFVGDICTEADRLNRMSQKLLQLSKMDINVSSEESHAVSVSEVLYKVYRMLSPIADQRNIRLLADVCDGDSVLSSEDDIYQVIFNLIENAIKYNTDSGTVKTIIRVEGGNVTILVEDTGVGIPEESLVHIFERFYRVDKARSRAAGGTGLGLSIVHDIVERNNGTITVSNREEGGSCFRLVFPQYCTDEEL